MSSLKPTIDFYHTVPSTKPSDYLIKVTKDNGQVVQYKIPIFGDAPFNTDEDLLNTCRTFNRRWLDLLSFVQFPRRQLDLTIAEKLFLRSVLSKI